MKIIGKTEDGKIAVAGIGAMYFETGLPLSFMFDRLKSENYIPSWIHLYHEFKNNGMSHKRIIDILHEQVMEVYGKEFRDVVIDRLNQYSIYLSKNK